MVSLVRTESQETAQKILETYRRKTVKSKSHDTHAKAYLPGGDSRTSTYFFPYPTYMEKGKGCYLYDCDGNQYIDFLNNYSSLIHGHAHPHILEAARFQLEEGAVLGSPSEIQYKHAEHLCARIPSMEMVRYCNSGTEATLMAMRAARAFTSKSVVIKMDGGYHGSHDFVEVNVSAYATESNLPVAQIEGPGIPAGVLNDTLVVPFNDLDAVETILKKEKDRIAAIILEPMLGAGGQIPPNPGYLKGLRELANKFGVLLIFDEVMTFRLSRGGMQAIYDVEPDITALAKIIGGGFAVGAFGGRKEMMSRFDPSHPECLQHSGTFNANNITMAAGLAAMEIYDHGAIDRINRLGDQLRTGFEGGFKKAGISGQTTGLGSLMQIHWGRGQILNARDAAQRMTSIGELPKLLHLEMINRGIFSAKRGMFVVSTPMTEREISMAVKAFEESLEVLKPYIAEVVPQLLCA